MGNWGIGDTAGRVILGQSPAGQLPLWMSEFCKLIMAEWKQSRRSQTWELSLQGEHPSLSSWGREWLMQW